MKYWKSLETAFIYFGTEKSFEASNMWKGKVRAILEGAIGQLLLSKVCHTRYVQKAIVDSVLFWYHIGMYACFMFKGIDSLYQEDSLLPHVDIEPFFSFVQNLVLHYLDNSTAILSIIITKRIFFVPVMLIIKVSIEKNVMLK